MEERSCRLFDDEVVRQIMITTGIAVFDYVRQHRFVDEAEINDFIDANADVFIADTLDQMERGDNSGGAGPDDADGPFGGTM
jgi:hypothetical protein